MLVENSVSGIAGLLDRAMVPIKSAFATAVVPERPAFDAGIRRIVLREEAACGISMEKLLFSGQVEAARSKAVEMIRAGRKIILEGFPLEEIAAWCFTHNYRWRQHHNSSSSNAFILEPGKSFHSDAKEAGAIT